MKAMAKKVISDHPNVYWQWCFVHRLQLRIEKAFTNAPNAKKLLNKCRQVNKLIRNSTAAKEMLNSLQRNNNVAKPLVAVEDVETRWDSQSFVVERTVSLFPYCKRIADLTNSGDLAAGRSVTRTFDDDDADETKGARTSKVAPEFHADDERSLQRISIILIALKKHMSVRFQSTVIVEQYQLVESYKSVNAMIRFIILKEAEWELDRLPADADNVPPEEEIFIQLKQQLELFRRDLENETQRKHCEYFTPTMKPNDLGIDFNEKYEKKAEMTRRINEVLFKNITEVPHGLNHRSCGTCVATRTHSDTSEPAAAPIVLTQAASPPIRSTRRSGRRRTVAVIEEGPIEENEFRPVIDDEGTPDEGVALFEIDAFGAQVEIPAATASTSSTAAENDPIIDTMNVVCMLSSSASSLAPLDPLNAFSSTSNGVYTISATQSIPRPVLNVDTDIRTNPEYVFAEDTALPVVVDSEDTRTSNQVFDFVTDATTLPRTNAVQFWKAHGDKYPRVRRYSQRYMSIPATSSLNESVNSLAGVVKNKRRTCLTCCNMKYLVTLTANKHLLKFDV